jgi:hypothetical protein
VLNLRNGMTLLVFTGMSASGKDTAGDYAVETRRARKITLSDIIRVHAGSDASNTFLRETGNRLRASYGAHILAKLAYEQLASSELGVIVSVRHPAEAEYLRAQGAHFVWFDGPVNVRHARYAHNRVASGRPAMAIGDFILEERLQYEGDGTGYSLKAVEAFVPESSRIWNDFPRVELFKAKLDEVLSAILINQKAP